MYDNAERIRLVIEKSVELRRRREKRKIVALKYASVISACLLVYCISAFSENYESGTVTGHYGAILLVNGIGGYVLTAVLAFIAAAIITAVCMKKRK